MFASIGVNPCCFLGIVFSLNYTILRFVIGDCDALFSDQLLWMIRSSTDGELRIWDTVQLRTLSSAWYLFQLYGKPSLVLIDLSDCWCSSKM